MQNSKKCKTAAYVLSRVGTGLGTVRGLAEGQMPITAITFVRREPIHYSRLCRIVRAPAHFENDDRYVEWIAQQCSGHAQRPVVLPTCDADALLLAKHAELLKPVARISSTSYADLSAIIDKSRLYSAAKEAGIPVLPCLMEPTLDQVEQWAQECEPPYLIKPFYAAIPHCSLREKNKRFESADELLNHVKQHGTRSCILQRYVPGGDGYIFDTYGLSDSRNRLVTYATHRRWRQFPVNVGVTSYGEIPADSLKNTDALFDYTRRLVSSARFHGIFGIEWLLDRRTKDWYLIDFNARPFSSIGHLTDCGLNLPLLAYYELLGELPHDVPERPALRHYYWVDLRSDLCSCLTNSNVRFPAWLRSVLRSRSFAYWSWRDPGPQIYRFWDMAYSLGKALRRQVTARFHAPAVKLPEAQPEDCRG